MSDNKLVKIFLDAVTLTGLGAGINWVSKKAFKRSFIADPSNSIENFVMLTGVVAGSIALKGYLDDQKILPNSV